MSVGGIGDGSWEWEMIGDVRKEEVVGGRRVK